MIISFYDENFNGLLNNASLSVESKSYKLVKKPIELNELSCICEAFTEDIQPTFVVVKNNRGQYVYGCLAGVPEINKKNQATITGTDLKNILSSDILIQPSSYTYVNEYISYLFSTYSSQVYQPFTVELSFKSNVGNILIGDLYPATAKVVVNCLEEIQSYLKYYNLYIDSELDLVNKKVKFHIGKTMLNNVNIKLWELGVKNYGKWIANTNECVGYYIDSNNTWTQTSTWILTKNNQITTSTSSRDIFPVRRKIVTSTESLLQATMDSLTTIVDSMYNENIELSATDVVPDFETNFVVYVNRGDANPYKNLPCGKLEYNDSGLAKFQIGYRYTDIFV